MKVKYLDCTNCHRLKFTGDQCLKCGATGGNLVKHWDGKVNK